MEVSDGIPPPLTPGKQNPRERRYPVRCTDWLDDDYDYKLWSNV